MCDSTRDSPIQVGGSRRGVIVDRVCSMWKEVLIYGLGGVVFAYFALPQKEKYSRPFTNGRNGTNYANVNPPSHAGYSTVDNKRGANLAVVDAPTRTPSFISEEMKDGVREGFSITPTYMTDDFTETNVAPVYAEEWQVPNPAYDHLDNPSDQFIPADEDVFEIPTDTRSYPYGQLLSRTNILPRDEMLMNTQLQGGHIQAKEYVNDYWTRNEIARRENLMRLRLKSNERRYRHTGRARDIFSPYKSY